MQRDAKFNDNELHHCRATPQSKLHLQLLGAFVTNDALHLLLLLDSERAILTTAPSTRTWCQCADPLGCIMGNHLAHCRVAQPGFLGNLRLHPTPLMRSDHLPLPLVLLSWTELF